ncbi:GNAT family N-acetyltransferase [Paenibacillus methanolicus]|uniref:ElaA protein n=1 Tax=Paenibacillus methanolicus TaxID=582686 RepID=A0A5S5CAK3_9BACL|nr:GNAT family N-acetyltransferase [Paenibacillus methanolicus]TYP76374.1 ElaA protein [Paenibacillus methanolicus]
MTWILKTFGELTTLELYRILQARTQVFVVEQQCPYPETDGKDLESVHLYRVDEEGNVVAYLRILPPELAYKEASIGRVLVSQKYRGQGIAAELVQRGLDYIREDWRETEVKIQAQAYLEKFYHSFGFANVSDVYLEDNIPHIDMKLRFE